MTKHTCVPEARVVDGIPNGRIDFPELLLHPLEDCLEEHVFGSSGEKVTGEVYEWRSFMLVHE